MKFAVKCTAKRESASILINSGKFLKLLKIDLNIEFNSTEPLVGPSHGPPVCPWCEERDAVRTHSVTLKMLWTTGHLMF